MTTIPLTHNKKAIVDDWNYEYLSQFEWKAVYFRGHWYAIRYVRGYYNYVYMQREITNTSGTRIKVKHINGNTLDNREANFHISETMRKFVGSASLNVIPTWVGKPESEILLLPEPPMNPLYNRIDCSCGQIFFGNIPPHFCKHKAA